MCAWWCRSWRYDLTEEEAIELGQRAIYHATHRDAYSGGTVRVYHITAAGWERISEDDSMDLYFKYMGTDEEKAEDREESGWKLVHGDVFRAPETSPAFRNPRARR